MGLEVLVGEARADLAQALVFLVLGVVAAKQKTTVDSSAFALAQITAHHHHVQSVAHTCCVAKKMGHFLENFFISKMNKINRDLTF